MKPYDCWDNVEIKKLNEQGISFNEWSILASPVAVEISNSTTTLTIPKNRFRAFSEWYLEDQK